MTDGILWLSFFLIVVLVFTTYRSTLTAMLFDPTYFASATAAPSGRPTTTAGGEPVIPGVNANPSTGTGL